MLSVLVAWFVLVRFPKSRYSRYRTYHILRLSKEGGEAAAALRIGLGGRLAQARTSSASTAHSAPRLKAWALRRARERGQKQGVCGCIGTR